MMCSCCWSADREREASNFRVRARASAPRQRDVTGYLSAVSFFNIAIFLSRRIWNDRPSLLTLDPLQTLQFIFSP